MSHFHQAVTALLAFGIFVGIGLYKAMPSAPEVIAVRVSNIETKCDNGDTEACAYIAASEQQRNK